MQPRSASTTLSPRFEDIENGPKPRAVEIFHVASDKAFRIRFSVEVTVGNCDSKQGHALNNRWSVREAMDKDFAITRTITGSLRLSGSPAVGNQFDPLAARNFAFPTLEDGFKRTEVSYQSSLDGLSLNYSVTDKQSHYAAPWPATEISGSHTTRTSEGHLFVSQASCRLTGPPHCSVPDLIARAVQFTQFRINWEGVGQNSGEGGIRIVDAYIREDIGDTPSVEVGVTLQENYSEGKTDLSLSLARLKGDRWGELEFDQLANPGTPGEQRAYRINWHPVSNPYGYDEHADERKPIDSAFLRCVLQSNCSGAANVGNNGDRSIELGSPSEITEQSTEVIEKPPLTELAAPELSSTFTDQHLNAMYMAVSQAGTFEWDHPAVALPIAAPEQPGQPTATIVKLSNQTSKRTVQIDYERLNKPPQIPTWEEHQIGRANLFPVSAKIKTLPPRLAADGNGLIYRVMATYTYIADRPFSSFDNIPIGRLPVLREDVASDQINLGDMIDRSIV